MDPRLQRLISDYQARVAEAIAMLNAAGIKTPSSAVEWIRMEFPESADLPGGFRYHKHGTGCAVGGPDWSVDFDFGAHGEIDGFDPHRLYAFARKRLSHYAFASEGEIARSFQAAHADGDLTFSGDSLYYLSSRSCAPSPSASTKHPRVFFVLRDFVGDLWAFSRGHHVWLMRSPANDQAARSVWDRESAGHSPLHGVTTFHSSGDRVADFYAHLGTVDEHHDGSARWEAIHVRGVGVEQVSADRIATTLGVDVRILREEDGFAIVRSTPPSASA